MKKLAALVALALAILGLSGCIVVPAYEHGYRSHYHGPGYYDPGDPYSRRGYYRY